MPNHVFNELIVRGGNAGNIMRQFVSVNDDEGTEFFDFNKIIETPPELLAIERGSLLFNGIKIIEQNKKPKDEYEEEAVKMAIKAMGNKEKYGFMDWYDWRVENWGTKWNSYDNYALQFHPDKFSARFCTAWDPPIPVMRKLAECYPKLSIALRYADELYNFVGYWNFVDGNIESRHYAAPDNGTLEKYKDLYYGHGFWKEKKTGLNKKLRALSNNIEEG